MGAASMVQMKRRVSEGETLLVQARPGEYVESSVKALRLTNHSPTTLGTLVLKRQLGVGIYTLPYTDYNDVVSASSHRSDSAYKLRWPHGEIEPWTHNHLAFSLLVLIMDDISEIFSHEALRLLEESGVDYGTEVQADGLAAEYPPSVALTPPNVHMKKRPRQSRQPVPGFSSNSLNNIVQTKRKRAKFAIKAREKVAAVRKKGACLRCRILKLSVCFLIFEIIIH